MTRLDMALRGPFTLRKGPEQTGGGYAWYEIQDTRGIAIVSINGIQIDGSGRKAKYPNGVISSRLEQLQHAEWTLKALNNAWATENAE